jgi:hypothetical protein
LLLALLLGAMLLTVGVGWLAHTAVATGQSERFTVEPGRKIELTLWILATETYGVSLWIGRPAELDRNTFDRLAGCPNSANPSKPVPGVTIPFRWIVRSSSDNSVVDQSKTASITPRGNGCSYVSDGHLFYLGPLTAEPGRYRLEFQFTEEIPELRNFPAEVSVSCCGKNSGSRLGALTFVVGLVLVPILLGVSALLALILLVRAAIFAWRSVRPRHPDTAA